MSDDPLEGMRQRIEKCRRLAMYVNDPRTTAALLEMAEEGEIDLANLLAERARNVTAPDNGRLADEENGGPTRSIVSVAGGAISRDAPTASRE